MHSRTTLLACLLLTTACETEEKSQTSAKAKGDADVAGDADAAPETKAAAKPVDPEKQAGAKRAHEAIASAPTDMKPTLAAAAIIDIDRPDLPPSLLEGLEAVTNAPPDTRAMLLAKSLTENIKLLDEVCGTDARALMQSLAVMPPAARDQALWDGCKLERHGLIEASDRPTSDPMLALFAHLVFIHAGKQRTLSEDERVLLKMMTTKVEPTP